MSKEAMKLALKKAFQLGQDYWYQADHESYRQNKKSDETLAKFRQLVDETCEALAKPDFWEGYVPEPVKPAQCKYPKCSYPCTDLPDCRDAEQPAQQALDKKAENARELGLDYEPAKDNSNYRFDPPGLDPSHQKPVAWWIPKAKQFCLPSSDGTRPFAKAWEPLYTSPPAQRKEDK